jgi:hypothetical protein
MENSTSKRTKQIDGIRATLKGLTSQRRNEYISLKAHAPKDAQDDVRQAYLIFQDDAMMDEMSALYL